MGSFSIWHWLIVLVIVLLIFGTKKLRNMGTRPRRRREGLQGRHEDGDESQEPPARSPPSRPHDRGRGEGPSRRPEPRAAPRGARASRAQRMFDIGFSELIVIGVVALVVIGPERLPNVARTLGLLFGRMQRYVNAGEVRHQPRDGARRARQA